MMQEDAYCCVDVVHQSRAVQSALKNLDAAGILYVPLEILLSPIIASASMAFSSVSVVLNSFRIKLLS